MTINAPTGVPPIVWLIIFLLVGPPALLSTWAAKLPGVLGAASRWWRREPSAASYHVSQSEIKRLVQDYQRIRDDYDSLGERMDRLEDELTDEKRRSWAALGYIRILIDSHQRNAPTAQIPPPPKALDGII